MTAAAVQSPNTPPALPGVLGVTSAVPQGRKKDVTAALRARRHRARKKANQINASVTVSSDGQRSPPVPGKRGSKSATLQAPNASVRSPVPASLLPKAPIHKTTFIAALMLAVVSGGYSIFGMASIFTCATIPVIGMGVALEIAKLSAVAWFGEGRGSRTLRGALLALVGVLMF
jgi:hypothetical protein